MGALGQLLNLDPAALGLIVLRTATVYVVLLLLLRLAGKRELGQLTTFDLVVILVISNAVQNAMVGPDTSLNGGLLAELTSLAGHGGNPAPCVVLVADPIRESLLGPLIGCGVVSILPWRGVTAELVAQAVLASHAGRALLPSTVARWLVDESRLTRHRPGAGACARPGPGGLSDREIDVLRLLADGQDTAQIAARLRYSERTIKKILQDLTTRLQLRNRTHAVSYALRIGAI